MSEQKKVEIYSTPYCQYCKKAKELFSENGVEYKEYNVAEDAKKRQEMIEKSGQLGVPFIVIGDQMIVGFDQEKIEEALNA